MSGYIDADALRKSEIKRCRCVPVIGSNENNYKDLDEVLNDAPTADVVEVRHGSFVWIADDSPMCNICGEVFDTNDNADAGLWKFCPNCGATMDGERRER